MGAYVIKMARQRRAVQRFDPETDGAADHVRRNRKSSTSVKPSIAKGKRGTKCAMPAARRRSKKEAICESVPEVDCASAIIRSGKQGARVFVLLLASHKPDGTRWCP